MSYRLPATIAGLPVPTLRDVLAAEKRIRPYLPETPVLEPPALAERLGAQVYLKCENLQPIGAFKIRGGVNLVSVEMASPNPPRGFATASTGNHGQSIAYAAGLLGVPACIYVPERPNPLKAAAMRRLGAVVVEEGRDFDEAREAAQRFAQEQGFRFVHPVREPLLVAGVATHTLELLRSVPDLDVLFVAVGAGSGACGAAIVAKAVNPDLRVVAVQAEGAPAVWRSWRQGRPLTTDAARTVAEGLATRVAYDYPVAILRELLDDFLVVSDEEMAEAVLVLLECARQVAEEAGAAALAAALKRPDLTRGRKVGLIISGGNITVERLAQILTRAGRR